MTEIITTYEPDNSLKKGYWTMFGEILQELRQNRWLTYQLFKRDFFASFKQSFLGVLWIVMSPLFSMGTFLLLHRSGIFSVGEMQVPYPIYALLGLAFWQVFSVGLTSSSNALVGAGAMIVKINFSKKSLVFASIGRTLVTFSMQFAFVCLLFILYRISPTAYILLLPLLLLPLLIMTIGGGLILAVFNGIVRDVSNILSKLLTFALFLTPILYARPSSGLLGTMTTYNPVYYLIAVPRDLILTGSIHHAAEFLLAALSACILFLVCLLAFHLTETRVAERI